MRFGASVALAAALSAIAISAPRSAPVGDAAAGQRIFGTICHRCHYAKPYTGRIGDENLAKFLANPRRYKPTTAMTFPGLRNPKDIADVIAFITEGH